MKPYVWCSCTDSMFDRPINIVAKGLKAKQFVTFHACTTIDNGNKFESFANYIATDEGCIDLSTNISHAGSYIGVEPMGLFWSMKPSPSNKKQHARLTKIDVTTPLVFTICLYDGFIKSIEDIHDLKQSVPSESHEITSITLNRWMMSSGTQRVKLTLEKDGICGALFIPSGQGPFPGVITLFGGYPGTLEYKASLLASHGYAALALAYAGLPGLPEIDLSASLQLEYFEKATQVLLNHPKVDNIPGIGLIGLSFSSFIVLAMAAFFKCVKCVIWINGFHYPMYGNFTYKGQTYSQQELDIFAKSAFDETLQVDNGSKPLFTGRHGYPKHIDPFHKDLDIGRIPFDKRFDVAYMFIAGLSDNSTPAEYYINQIEKILKAAKHSNYQLLRYPGAGHMLEPCYGIHHYITPLRKMYITLQNWGGETYPHCKAQEDSWQKQLDFLKFNLIEKNMSKL